MRALAAERHWQHDLTAATQRPAVAARDPLDGDSSAPHWARGPWDCSDWRANQADGERAPTGGAASPVPAGSSVLAACASEASSGKWRGGGVETGKRPYCVVRLVLRPARLRRARDCFC